MTLAVITDVIDRIIGIAGTVQQKRNAATASNLNNYLKSNVMNSKDARFFDRPVDSIAATAKKSILYFPVVCSDSVSEETSVVVARALQVRNAEYAKLVVMNTTTLSSKHELLNALGGSALTETTILNLDKKNKPLYFKEPIEQTLVAESTVSNNTIQLDEDRLQMLLDHPDFFNLSDHLQKTASRLSRSKSPLTDIATRLFSNVGDTKDQVNLTYILNKNVPLHALTQTSVVIQKEVKAINAYAARYNLSKPDAFKIKADPSKPADSQKTKIEIIKRDGVDYIKGDNGVNTGITNVAKGGMNFDFDKVNRFTPLMLNLEINIKDQATGEVFQSQLLIGIKSILHRVSSVDSIQNLGQSFFDNSAVFQFLRFTSGEISFFKDFLFNVDTIKDRVHGTKGVKMLETLKRQTEHNTARSSKLSKTIIGDSVENFIPPTTSLVLSMTDVITINNKFKVDLMSVGNVKKLLQNYNLLGLFIVDQDNKVMYSYEDADSSFDMITFKEIEKQSKQDSVKDLMSILSKT